MSNIKLVAQIECGFQPDNEDIEEIQDFIISLQPSNPNPQENCSDVEWNGGDVTYRVVIEYTDLTPFSVIEPVVEYTKHFYARFGIHFNVMYVRNPCQNCPFYDSPGWSQPFSSNINFPNCLYGRITRDCSPFLNGNMCGNGLLGRGIFFVQIPNELERQNMVHELGHALGLFHTFDSFSETSNEKVSPSSSCTCNCLTHGDRICDTKTDPFVQFDNNWNTRMFNPASKIVQNLDNKVDVCGTPFQNIPNQAKLFSNIMSYHYTPGMTFNEIEYEPGQVALIKHWNNSKPWKVDTQSDYTIIPGFEVNTAKEIINKNYIIASDIVVKSALKLKNCNIKFTNNAKIQILNKGDLLIDNTILSKHIIDNNFCLNVTNEQWSGISVETTNYSPTVNIKNNSVVSSVTGAVIKTGNLSKLRLYVTNNSTLNGSTVLNMSNQLLNAFISHSTINGRINSPINGPGQIIVNNSTIQSILAVGKNISVSNQSNISGLLQTTSYGGQHLSLIKSSLDGELILFNSGSSIISNNYVSGRIWVQPESYPKLTIRDNDFYYDNNFVQRITINNSLISNTSNLIFKNHFHSTTNSICVVSNNPNLSIECNDFNFDANNLGTTDLLLNSRIADPQGDDKLAAGNKFSGKDPEILEFLSSKLRYYYKNPGTREEPVFIQGSGNFTKINNNNSIGSKCNVSYPPMLEVNPAHCFNGIKDENELGIDCGGSCQASCPEISAGEIGVIPNFPSHCSNGIPDGNETGVDCGGSCPPCFTNHCNDGIPNGDETGVDCGGVNCPPCNTNFCSDGIENYGETGIDCGGPCPPCFTSSCSDGLMNGNETGVDCGGSCSPCPPSCFDGIQNGEETSVDCGGSCPPCGGNCSDGIQNNGEYFIDCGGPCSPCIFDDFVIPSDTDYTDFIDELNGIYGSDTIPQGSDIEIDTDVSALNALYDSGNTFDLVDLIETQSASNPDTVYNTLQQTSPYVSPTAFHTLFKYSQYFTEVQVKEILTLNPGALEDLYVYYIVFKSGSFTDSLRQVLWSSIQVQDSRTNLNHKIRIKKLYMDYLIQQRIVFHQQLMKCDFNKIRTQYQKNHDHDVPYFVYHTYINEGKYNQAWIYLDSIDENSISDPYYKNQLEKLKVMEDILMNYYYAGNRNVALPSDKRQVLIDIAESNNGLATMKARMILEELYTMTFGDFPPNSHYKPLTFLSNSNPRTKGQKQIKIVPNPASTQLMITLEYFEGASGGDGEVVILDLSGKVVIRTNIKNGHVIVDISSLISSMYQYKVNLISGDTYQGKFVKIE